MQSNGYFVRGKKKMKKNHLSYDQTDGISDLVFLFSQQVLRCRCRCLKIIS